MWERSMFESYVNYHSYEIKRSEDVSVLIGWLLACFYSLSNLVRLFSVKICLHCFYKKEIHSTYSQVRERFRNISLLWSKLLLSINYNKIFCACIYIYINWLVGWLVGRGFLCIKYYGLSNAKSSLYIYIKHIWFGLVGFYGISNFVGYLMLNYFYTYILNIWLVNTFCW